MSGGTGRPVLRQEFVVAWRLNRNAPKRDLIIDAGQKPIPANVARRAPSALADSTSKWRIFRDPPPDPAPGSVEALKKIVGGMEFCL